jgi:hypothetical protein
MVLREFQDAGRINPERSVGSLKGDIRLIPLRPPPRKSRWTVPLKGLSGEF